MDFDRYYDNRNDVFGLIFTKDGNIEVYDLMWGVKGQPVHCGTIHKVSLEEWDNMLDCDKRDLIVTNV